MHSHPSVVRVTDRLAELGATGSVKVLDGSARTAAQAAEQLGIEVAQIANSLVFSADGTPLLVLASGGHRVDTTKVAALVGAASVDDYEALLLPGGTVNPDKLRMEPAAVAFVRQFVESGKPVASICHGPWNFVEADVARGRRLTSWPSVRTDLRNAGAEVVDEEVVTDGNITTSRSPDDLPAFCERIVQEFAKVPQPADAGGVA